jgi:hypothetical protein
MSLRGFALASVRIESLRVNQLHGEFRKRLTASAVGLRKAPRCIVAAALSRISLLDNTGIFHELAC